MDDRRSDRVFKAVADKHRRRILDLLAQRPHTTSELAAAFPGRSRFAVMKHLGILHRAGLLVVTREGRRRWNAINAVPMRDVLRRWVSRHEEQWADFMLNIRDAAELPHEETKGSKKGN